MPPNPPPSMPPPFIAPVVTPKTRLRALFSEVLGALAKLADVMATWSWWRVLALSLLLFIAGIIIDDFLFTSTSSTKKTVSVDAIDRQAKKATKKADRELNFPEDIQNGKVSILIDKDGVKVERASDAKLGATSDAAKAPEAAKTTGPTKGAEPLNPAGNTDLVKTEATKKEAARTAPKDNDNADEDTTELEQKIEQVIEQVMKEADKKNGGAKGKIKIHFDTDSTSETKGPFKALAFLMSLAMWISKIIGGSRLREQAATFRADVATASLQSQSLERQIAEAKLLRMQAQVEPHFLFNTLAALERLIETNPTRALAMSQALSQWLRALLPQMKEGQSTLGQEVTLVQNYLQLMQMRMGERLAYFIDVPENLRAEALPTMLLQPLVENSIKHGLEPKRTGGEVRIKARRVNDVIELVVEDTGIGFSANPGSGNGLTNLRERLDLIYNGRAMVSVIPRASQSYSAEEPLCGTVITIKIPVPKKQS